MVEHSLLPEKQISGWRCCYGEEFPSEDTDQTVVFKSFYEKGFMLPMVAFFRGLLHFYELEVRISSPTRSPKSPSSSTSARGTWGSLPTSTCDGLCTVRRNVVGGAAFSQRQGRVYPDFKLRDTNRGWVRQWFAVSNSAPCLPACTGCTPE
jgi:hypothetical protein